MACEDILEATKELFLPGEMLYISTDEVCLFVCLFVEPFV
jgi:hypothetical protein